MLNRYQIQIALSLFLMLIPILAYLHMEWLQHRPRTGPVGNGIIHEPNGYEIAILISIFVMGVLQLILSIQRYIEYKKSLQKDKEQ